jgi:hypothetical protein
MNNLKKVIGISHLFLVVMLVFTMMVVGCDLLNVDDNNNGGTFTLNNIPAEFNGKYVYFSGFGEGTYFFGFQGVSAGVYTLCKISNGSVSMPTWTGDDESGANAKRYSGNGTIPFRGYIFDSQTITMDTANSHMVGGFRPTAPVAFKNGSATKSWSDVDYTPNTDNGNNHGNNNNGNGTFTLNNIPAEFNGKYVFLSGFGEGTYVFCCQSISAGVYTLCLISNGSVSMPTWTGDDDSGANAKRYSGNGDIPLRGYIFDSQTITMDTADSFMVGGFRPTAPVAFTNGSATMSWNDVEYYPAEE